MRRIGPKVLLAALIVMITSGLAFKASAADSPPALGLTVSPPSYELSAKPGDVLENSIRITNQSANTVTFQAETEDFKVEGTEGRVIVAADQDPNAFSKWFKLAQTEFTLKAKDSTIVTFRINVPQNAEPGGHFASVLFKPKAVAAPAGQTGAQVIQRVGTLVLMRISGAVTEDADIASFKSKSFVGTWDEVTASDGKTIILIAKDEKLDAEKPRGFFDHGPIAFDVLFKNDGNVHIKPAGSVSIYNLFGKKVTQLALDPRNVFPQGQRRITVIWPQKSLWWVYYRAEVTALYGNSNKVITSETHFIGFPVVLLAVFIIVLVLLMLLRRRLARAFRVLIQGK